MDSNKKLLHRLFRISLVLKGIDSFLEIIGGILLFVASPSQISSFVKLIFQHELMQDPNDLIGNFLVNISSNLSQGTQLFGTIYLLSHGIIKLALIIGLWKKKLWTYIAAEIVFVIFIIYQSYRFAFTHSIYLLVLTFFDLIVIILTWWEYMQLIKNSNLIKNKNYLI